MNIQGEILLTELQKLGCLHLTCCYSKEPFVKATYVLEGDGALALIAYERLSMLFSAITAEHYSNVKAVANQLSGGNSAREQQLVAYAIQDKGP